VLTERDGSYAIRLRGRGPWTIDVAPLAAVSIFEEVPTPAASITCETLVCDVTLKTDSERLAHDACPVDGPTFAVLGRTVSADGVAISEAFVLAHSATGTQTQGDRSGWFFLCLSQPEVTLQFIAPGYAIEEVELSFQPSTPIIELRVVMESCEARNARPGRQVRCIPLDGGL